MHWRVARCVLGRRAMRVTGIFLVSVLSLVACGSGTVAGTSDAGGQRSVTSNTPGSSSSPDASVSSRLQNLSYRVGADGYEINFVLYNDTIKDLTKLEGIELSMGEFSTSLPATATGTLDWNKKSSVCSLKLPKKKCGARRGEGVQSQFDCYLYETSQSHASTEGSSCPSTMVENNPIPEDFSETISLTVKGLLEDGEPFSATAEGKKR